MPLNVVETFSSIQGEGLLVGTPSIFVRFHGCNLNCEWCDTKFANNNTNYTPLFPRDLIDDIGGRNEKHVVLTGGEPLLQDLDELNYLVHMLSWRKKKSIQIETNGTLIPTNEVLSSVNHVTISPKLPSSGNNVEVDLIRWSCLSRTVTLELKFVIGHVEKDFQGIRRYIDKLKTVTRFTLDEFYWTIQPEWSIRNIYPVLPYLVENYIPEIYEKVRFIPQVHKFFNVK